MTSSAELVMGSPASVGKQEAEAIRVHSRQAEEFAARYRVCRAEPFSSCFAYSRHRLEEWLESLLPSPAVGRRLLDVGCGTGHHLVHFVARGFEVTGIDGSAEMLRYARSGMPGATLQRAAVEALPFAAESFDVVVSIEVLRYLSEPMRCLRELARVLRPGGVCLVTAAPRLNLNGYWAINRLATVVPLPRMVRLKQYFTTSRMLRKQLIEAGFERPEIHGVYLGPINWIERVAPRTLPVLLRRWERFDRTLADQPVLRDLSNMVVARAERQRCDGPS